MENDLIYEILRMFARSREDYFYARIPSRDRVRTEPPMRVPHSPRPALPAYRSASEAADSALGSKRGVSRGVAWSRYPFHVNGGAKGVR